MTGAMRIGRMAAAVWAGLLGGTVFASSLTAATLELRGEGAPAQKARTLLDPVARGGGDSTTVSRALGRLVAALQDEGFLDARATAQWNPRRDTLRVDLATGPAHRFRSVELRALSAADSAVLGPALGLGVGEPASPAAVAAALDRALGVAAEAGYPYARVTVSDWVPDSAGVRLVVSGGLGPQVRIVGARYEGLRLTRPALLTRALGPLGGVYRRSEALAARDRIEQLALFRRVELLDLEGAGEFGRANLVMRVEEPAYSRFEGVVGTQGSGGLVGLARVELDNLAGTGRAAAVRWEAQGQGISQFAARYAEPLVLGLPLRAETSLEHQMFDTLFTRTRGRLAGRWMLSAAERLDAGVEFERVIQDLGEVSSAATQTTRLGFVRTRFDDPIEPRRGGTARLEASQSFTRERLAQGVRRSVRSSAVEAAVERLVPVGSRSAFALDMRGAARFGSRDILALYDRYPLGGSTSLRGYDEEAFRVDRYGLSRLEWRWFLPARQHAFVFWDHATAWTRLPTADGDRSQLLHRDGMGVGLRLAASSGRIGVTYGVAAGRGPLEGKLHLQLISPF